MATATKIPTGTNLRLQKDGTVTLNPYGGAGYVCSVPAPFIAATAGAWTVTVPAKGDAKLRGEEEEVRPIHAESLIRELEKVEKENEPTTRQYWPAPGEEPDLHHIAYRVRVNLLRKLGRIDR